MNQRSKIARDRSVPKAHCARERGRGSPLSPPGGAGAACSWRLAGTISSGLTISPSQPHPPFSIRGHVWRRLLPPPARRASQRGQNTGSTGSAASRMHFSNCAWGNAWFGVSVSHNSESSSAVDGETFQSELSSRESWHTCVLRESQCVFSDVGGSDIESTGAAGDAVPLTGEEAAKAVYAKRPGLMPAGEQAVS